MIPDIETFRKAVKQYRGNLSKVAEAFGVTRSTVGNWRKDPAYAEVVEDARKRLFDDCLSSAEVLAKGIIAYETQVDPETGKEKKVPIGWSERPDGNMLRYLIGFLGRDEGFDPNPEPTDKAGTTGAPPININVVFTDKKDLEMQEQMQGVKGKETKQEE